MRLIPLFYALFLIGGDCLGIGETADNHARILKAASSDPVPLNVYNWEDYIQDDEDLNGDNVIQDDEKGLITLFEEKMLEEGINVQVNYSTFDTNETMLAEMKTGKAHYDLVCPSDYVIQKMIADDLIQPFDEGSTPNYDRYVSPFVKEKIGEIEVEGHEKGVVNDYARGYMWGTLGLLYNPGFSGVLERGISEDEMRQDLSDWTNLWDEKYKNLLAIKDSMRDTYAVGIMKTYDQDFELDGESHEGFSTLKRKYEEGLYDDEEYNAKVSEIFNLHDDDTLARVGRDLQALKENAFGFEVDSGKVDMARGMYFAINVAWSGDAAYAMDMADENNEAHEGENGFTPTILKYLLPDTGANIWFDGWVIPKDAQHKDLPRSRPLLVRHPLQRGHRPCRPLLSRRPDGSRPGGSIRPQRRGDREQLLPEGHRLLLRRHIGILLSRGRRLLPERKREGQAVRHPIPRCLRPAWPCRHGGLRPPTERRPADDVGERQEHEPPSLGIYPHPPCRLRPHRPCGGVEDQEEAGPPPPKGT